MRWPRCLLAACLLIPWSAGAQPPVSVPRIGFLDPGSVAARVSLWEAFRQGMRELGYVEGRTVLFEARGAEGKTELLPALATELVGLKVDAIVTTGTPAAQAARQATATIPIVMATGADPVGLGLVASLARPDGNMTGLTSLSRELSAKRLELARELVPGASRFAMLWATGSLGSAAVAKATEAAAHDLGVRFHAIGVRSAAELDGAFSTMARERTTVLLVDSDPTLFESRQRLAELAVKHRLPTVHSAPEYVEAGGLIAYGADRAEMFRRAAVYVDKILKGTKPADLPIEQPTKFELIINLKTAKALRLTIPPSL
jgi:putative ABC transport system substrate-binding protein